MIIVICRNKVAKGEIKIHFIILIPFTTKKKFVEAFLEFICEKFRPTSSA